MFQTGFHRRLLRVEDYEDAPNSHQSRHSTAVCERLRKQRGVAAIAFVLLTAPAAQAATVDYAKDIKVIFKERCVSCHGSVKQKGGLRLDAGALILKGGKHPVVEPGNSSRSALMERVLSADDEERMPPEGKRLTAGQIGLRRRLTGVEDRRVIAKALT